MARPRKLATEVMIEIVDSYYLTRSDGNEKLMKCSLIAEYAAELGYSVEGYDFARNMEVREHIECIKVFAETSNDVYGKKYMPTPVYKSLDVNDFLYSNRGEVKLANAIRDLDAYWKRVFEYSAQAERQNRALLKEKASYEAALLEVKSELDRSVAENSELSASNNRLVVENRYLRKMIRTYLYPAVADEVLKNENDVPQTDTEATAAAVCDYIENGIPKSFEASVSKDDRIQSEAELLIEKLWRDI
jgi:hypothetical protein